MLCTGPAQGKHPMNDGCFHHAWGESPTADTLGAGVSPSHSAPGVWLPGCSPSWSGSASQPEAAGSWTRQAGEVPVDIMFLPRNGKAGMFQGKEQGSGASMPGTSAPPSPLPGASPARAGPCGEEDTLQRRPGLHGAPGTSVHTLVECHMFTNSPTALPPRTDRRARICIQTSTPTWPCTHLCSFVHM